MGAGRKGKYEEWLTDDGLLFIEGWARHGLSDEQIARDNIGVRPETFCRWKAQFPQLSQALKKGRAPIAFEIENQFIKSSLGYKVTLKKPVKLKEEKSVPGKGKIVSERIEYVEEEIYIKPETANQIFYLKNHMPDIYKDRREEVVTASIVDQTTIDEIEDFLNGISSGEEEASDTAEN